MGSRDIGAYEAKTHFSRLLAKVQAGHRFYITRRGKRLAELRPVTPDDGHPRYGCDRGRVTMGDDFDAPIPGFDEYER